MIQFTDVTKSYTEGNTALNGVSLQIEDGVPYGYSAN